MSTKPWTQIFEPRMKAHLSEAMKDIGIVAATTISVAASDALNPDAYTYKCDGVADDVQIQAAIDALPAAGGKVVLSEGRFSVAAKISIPSNTRLVGTHRLTQLDAVAQTIMFETADGADIVAIERMHLNANSVATAINVLGATSGASRFAFRDLIISAVPSGKYGIDIEWLISSDLVNIYMSGVANGIRWQNLRAGSAGGNTRMDNIYVALLAATAGTGLEFGSASASYSNMQSIAGMRTQVVGDGTAGQVGIKLINVGSSVFIETDLEILDKGIDFSDNANHNTFLGGYLGRTIGTRGVKFDSTSWLNKILGPMRIDGTDAGGDVGIEDLNTTANASNIIEDVDIQDFTTEATTAGQTQFRSVALRTAVEHHSTGDTLLCGEMGSVHTNATASGAIELLLPTDVVAGSWFEFSVMVAQALRIQPPSGGAFYINGALQANDKYISADAPGESIKLIAIGSNQRWVAMGTNGTWTVEA